jgi:hypothetical protein
MLTSTMGSSLHNVTIIIHLWNVQNGIILPMLSGIHVVEDCLDP